MIGRSGERGSGISKPIFMGEGVGVCIGSVYVCLFMWVQAYLYRYECEHRCMCKVVSKLKPNKLKC